MHFAEAARVESWATPNRNTGVLQLHDRALFCDPDCKFLRFDFLEQCGPVCGGDSIGRGGTIDLGADGLSQRLCEELAEEDLELADAGDGILDRFAEEPMRHEVG
jgi:hypothetical protein